MAERTWREGGCHCKAVRFRARLSADEVIDCNCSVCAMKAYLHIIIPPQDFELLPGEELLSTYRYGTMTAAHTFCSVCGISPFYTPRSHPDCIDVNARCLDHQELEGMRITPFDGANWDENVHRIREGS